LVPLAGLEPARCCHHLILSQAQGHCSALGSDVSQWLERGAVLFDQRKTIPYGTMDGLSKEAQQVLESAWSSGDPEQIKSAHEQFMRSFRTRQFPPSSYLRTDVTLEDLLQWLYQADHIHLT
jgi:hypothetical protein